MKTLNKYNKGSGFEYQIPEGVEFKKLKDLYSKKDPDQTFPVYLLGVTKGGDYGPSAYAATDGCMISLPNHLVDTVRDMIADPEIKQLANAGELALKIVPYKRKDSKQTYFTVEWLQVDSADLPY